VLQAPNTHAQAVGQQQHEAEAERRPADQRHAAEPPGDDVLREEPDDHHRHGGEHEVERQAAVGRAPQRRQVAGTNDQAQHVAPEVEQDGAQRADMHRDIDKQALVRPVGEPRHQDQVRRGTDRQELGDALDQRQDDDLDQRHRRGLPSRRCALIAPPRCPPPQIAQAGPLVSYLYYRLRPSIDAPQHPVNRTTSS